MPGHKSLAGPGPQSQVACDPPPGGLSPVRVRESESKSIVGLRPRGSENLLLIPMKRGAASMATAAAPRHRALTVHGKAVDRELSGSGRASPAEPTDACPEATAGRPPLRRPHLLSCGARGSCHWARRALRGSAFKGLPTPCFPLLAGLRGFLPDLLCPCLGFAVCIFFSPLFKSQAKGKR